MRVPKIWRGPSQRIQTVLRMPVMGSLLFGLVVGGIPLAVVFARLGGRVVSPELLRFMVDLTPVAIVVVTVGVVLTARGGWKDLLCKALLASFGACTPLPITVCAILAWMWGYPV